ncbi:outer membrane lipoprotein-sorting protein [Oleomonas cavernae]|nr:outer membrane lipoprotein-sorting protein [Oleomonas cavernae]
MNGQTRWYIEAYRHGIGSIRLPLFICVTMAAVSAAAAVFELWPLALPAGVLCLTQAADCRSRLREYAILRRLLALGRIEPAWRFARRNRQSLCQRSTMRAAWRDATGDDTLPAFYRDLGYRWRHFVPDELFTRHSLVLSGRFWLCAFSLGLIRRPGPFVGGPPRPAAAAPFALRQRRIAAACAFTGFVAVAIWASVSLADGASGRAIMDEVAARHDLPHEFAVEAMLIKGADGREARRVFRRYARAFGPSAYRYLLTVDEPASVHGTAVLTWQRPGEPDDQWTYLPALSVLKRVIGGGRRSSFAGSDFTHEDLVNEDRDDYTYVREGDEAIAGAAVFVVTATPTADIADDSSYAFRRLYIRQDNYLIVETRYYERGSGRPLKTFTVEEAEPVTARAWRPRVAVMTDLVTGGSTRVTTVSRSIAADSVPEDVFSHRFLESRAHL